VGKELDNNTVKGEDLIKAIEKKSTENNKIDNNDYDKTGDNSISKFVGLAGNSYIFQLTIVFKDEKNGMEFGERLNKLVGEYQDKENHGGIEAANFDAGSAPTLLLAARGIRRVGFDFAKVVLKKGIDDGE
jgi:hypothetical protein